MREIKFRGWDGKKMMDALTLSEFIELGHSLGNYPKEYIDHWTPDLIFMQYTGIKNNDGFEIYDGDIVCYDDDIKGVIKFDTEANPLGWFVDMTDGRRLGLYTNMKLLGNIYENPDLLK